MLRITSMWLLRICMDRPSIVGNSTTHVPAHPAPRKPQEKKSKTGQEKMMLPTLKGRGGRLPWISSKSALHQHWGGVGHILLISPQPTLDSLVKLIMTRLGRGYKYMLRTCILMLHTQSSTTTSLRPAMTHVLSSDNAGGTRRTICRNQENWIFKKYDASALNLGVHLLNASCALQRHDLFSQTETLSSFKEVPNSTNLRLKKFPGAYFRTRKGLGTTFTTTQWHENDHLTHLLKYHINFYSFCTP